MICKQEVCAWFKGLSGAKRIDLMCGLLQICLAPELRFIGSCLEDLCRKDYDALRTLEVEANNIQHIQTLTSDLLDNMMRAKWNLILPLLESTNTVCANAMYSVLCDCIDKILLDVMQLQKENSSSRNCREIMDDILLLLTMASNHPAFSFTHKLKFDNCLTDLQALQEEESCDDRKSSQPHTTSVQQSQTKKPEAVHHPSSEQRPPPPPPPPSHSHNAEVNGHSHPHRSTPSQGNNSHHGNGIGGVANRDNGVGGRDGSQSNGGGGDAGNDVVHSRIQSPRHALSKPINIIKGGTDLGEEDSGNIVNSRGAITTQIIYNSHLPPDHRSPQTPTPQTPPHSEVLCSPGRPPILSSTNLLTTRPSSSTPQTFHGVLVSGAGSPLPSSPLSSPHVSPSSSVHSASSSCSSSSCSSSTTTPNPNSVAVWLKRIRLHKYTEMLQGFSFSDLLQLTDKDLENLKLTKGAQKKIRKEIDKLNMLGEHAEKWVNGGTSPLTIWTPPPSEHSPSPYNSPSSQQAPLQLKPAPAPVVISSAATSSTVTSPSSEFTSPPESPLVVMPANSQQQNKDLPPTSSIGSNGGSSQPLPSVPTANAPPPPPPMTFPPPHMAPKSPCGSTTSSGSINDSLNGDAPPPPPPMPSLPPGPRPMLPMPLDYQLVPPPHLYNYNLYHLAAMANGPRPLLRSPINPTHSFPPPPPPPAPTSTQPSPAPSPGSGLRSRPTSLHGLPPSPPTMFLPPGDRNSPGPGPVSTSSTVPTSTNVTFCTSFSTSFQGPVAATTSFCYPPTASPTPPLPRTASTPTPPPPPTPTQQQPLPPIMCCNQCGTSTPIYWPFPPHSANGLLPMPPAPPPLMRPPHNGFIQPGAAHTLSQQQQPQHSTTTPATPGQYIMPPPPPPPQYMALHPCGGGHTGHGGHGGSHHPGGAGGAGGSKHKAGAHITCYRCGGPGHRAIECKKHIPPSPGSMESKTGFHLKYAAPPPPPPVAGGE